MKPVRLLAPSSLIFTEMAAVDNASQALAMWWHEYASTRPALFNGPLVACHSCELGPDGTARVEWYRTSYAHYLQRVAPNPVTHAARALFCSVVLLSNTRELVIGQMSENTSSPLRLQLPGGNITLPSSTGLSLAHCATDACQELREEVGISLDVSDLRLWRVKTGGTDDDVGVIFECQSTLSNAQIQGIFNEHQDALRSHGEAPELKQLTFVRPIRFRSDGLNCVDYLPSVAQAIAAMGA